MYIVKSDPNVVKFKAIIYASIGMGKTQFASGAQDHPDMRNVLFANIEGGLLTVAYRGDIRAEDITHAEELEILHSKLANREGDYKEVRTICIDSGSELQMRNLTDIVARAAAENERRYSKRSDYRPRNTSDIWQEDYGESTTQLSRIFRMFYDLPMNVIMTALPRFTYPKGVQGVDVQPSSVSPQFTPKLGVSVAGYADMVWYMYRTDDNVRHMLTQPRGVYQAKTRGKLFAAYIGPVIDVPDNFALPEIYDLLLDVESGKVKMSDDEMRERTEDAWQKSKGRGPEEAVEEVKTGVKATEEEDEEDLDEKMNRELDEQERKDLEQEALDEAKRKAQALQQQKAQQGSGSVRRPAPDAVRNTREAATAARPATPGNRPVTSPRPVGR